MAAKARCKLKGIEMGEISDTELHQVFQSEYPKDLGQLARATEQEAPYDFEARTETGKFSGKRWEEIGTDLLQDCYDVPLLFNPRAFHYFFPAFIKQSQVDMEKTSLLVNTLINFLADSGIHWPESLKDAEAEIWRGNPEISEAIESINEKDLSAWRQERWKLFTEQQWALVRKWLDWIGRDEQWEVDRDVLREAVKNAGDWQTKRAGVPHRR
jgi:hypothetical protein